MSKRASPPTTAEIAAYIKRLLLMGRFHQHQIAAFFGLNQGRVSEIKSGKKWAHVPPADRLPDGFLA